MGQTIDINTANLKTGIGKLKNQKDNLTKFKKMDSQMKGSGLSVEKMKKFNTLYVTLADAISVLYSNTIDYMESLAQSAKQTDEAIASSFRNGE